MKLFYVYFSLPNDHSPIFVLFKALCSDILFPATFTAADSKRNARTQIKRQTEFSDERKNINGYVLYARRSYVTHFKPNTIMIS
jgi:hypothetical protein